MAPDNNPQFGPPLIQGEGLSNETLIFLEQLDISTLKLGLERMRQVLATLDDPQDAIPMIHIAGTNGKGSVTAMLSAILKAAGYRVGRFTSPHLVDVRERIVFNETPISVEDFESHVQSLKTHLENLNWLREQWPTYFEFLNSLAYQYFRNQKADITIFETGLGGRLDSTNVVHQPCLTVITSISLDHMQYLGNTLALIASEKAGILKAGSPLILGSQLTEEAHHVIMRRAEELGVKVSEVDASTLRISTESSLETGLCVDDLTTGLRHRMALAGRYQKDNLAVVLACVDQLRTQGYTISEGALERGLAQTHWPVRFQYLPEQNVILDGSHNEAGFQSLLDSLNFYCEGAPVVWMLSLRNNRNPAMLTSLVTSFGNPQGIVLTKGTSSNSYHELDVLAENIAKAGLSQNCPIELTDDPQEAFSQMLRLQQEAHSFTEWGKSLTGGSLSAQPVLGVITGSLYTAGEILYSTCNKP